MRRRRKTGDERRDRDTKEKVEIWARETDQKMNRKT